MTFVLPGANITGLLYGNGVASRVFVRVATTTAGTLASSFANGSSIDGVTLVTGNRILIKNQASAIENGIYIVAASGAPTRSDDYAAGQNGGGVTVYVSVGTTQANTGWLCTSVFGSDIIGTNTLSYQQTSGTGVDGNVITNATQTLSNKSLIDNSTFIVGNADATRQITFSSSGNSTATTLTIASAQTTSRTLNVPNLTANDTIDVLGLAQTFTAVKTFNVSPVMNSLTASQLVATDGAKSLVSVNYVSTATANTIMLRDANANVRTNNMIENYTTTATAAGTTVLTVASSKQQYFTGTLTQTVQMPVTSTLVLGQSFLIKNRSTQSITINASDSSAISTLLTGDDCTVTCIDTAVTTSAAWNINVDGLATQLRSATTNINVVAATAPTSGQALTATSGTAATWQSVANSITGTANQITASAATGAITLSTPSTFIAPGSIASTTTLTVGTIYQDTPETIAAAGTTQGTATGITKSYVIVNSVITGTNIGVRLPLAVPGMRITISNKSGNTTTPLSVFPRNLEQIDGVSINGPVSIPNGFTATYESDAVLHWYTINSVILGTTDQITVGISGGVITASIPNIFIAPGTVSATALSARNLTNQISVGTTNITTLNFPAPAGTVTLTFPNTADTMVGRATTDTLTNKTITSTTNTVRASELATTGASVVLTAGAPPTTGQVLIATSPTAAAWQNNTGGETIDTVSTSTTTPTTISTIPTSSDTVYYVNVKLAAKTTPSPTSAAGYELKATYKNVAGVLTQVGTDDKLSIENVPGWDVNTGTSGTNIIIIVTGTGVNINWKSSWSVVSV